MSPDGERNAFMRIEQVMFRSGPVRCAGDLYLPDGADGSLSRTLIRILGRTS
jgi:hypothetical protein